MEGDQTPTRVKNDKTNLGDDAIRTKARIASRRAVKKHAVSQKIFVHFT